MTDQTPEAAPDAAPEAAPEAEVPPVEDEIIAKINERNQFDDDAYQVGHNAALRWVLDLIHRHRSGTTTEPEETPPEPSAETPASDPTPPAETP